MVKTKVQSVLQQLRKIVQKSTLKEKKKILVQHGGFLQYLIPAAITGISEIISSLIRDGQANHTNLLSFEADQSEKRRKTFNFFLNLYLFFLK